jgi:hypothetical protein
LPSWVIALLRVVGIRRAADVVPVATKIATTVRDVVDPPEPGQPLPYTAVRDIQRQIESATSHRTGNPPARVVAASAPAAGAVREAPGGAGAAGTRGAVAPPRRAPRPGVAKATDRTAITPRAVPRKEPEK